MGKASVVRKGGLDKWSLPLSSRLNNPSENPTLRVCWKFSFRAFKAIVFKDLVRLVSFGSRTTQNFKSNVGNLYDFPRIDYNCCRASEFAFPTEFSFYTKFI